MLRTSCLVRRQLPWAPVFHHVHRCDGDLVRLLVTRELTTLRAGREASRSSQTAASILRNPDILETTVMNVDGEFIAFNSIEGTYREVSRLLTAFVAIGNGRRVVSDGTGAKLYSI